MKATLPSVVPSVLRAFSRSAKLQPTFVGRGLRPLSARRRPTSGISPERALAFDAPLLKSRPNVLQRILPAGQIGAGILSDYLRLELDETASLAVVHRSGELQPALRTP